MSTLDFRTIEVSIKDTSLRAYPDINGEFRFDGVPTGDQSLEVKIDNDLSSIDLMDIQSQEEIRMQLQIQENNSVMLQLMYRDKKSSPTLQLEIRPKKWNVDWATSVDEGHARIYGTGFETITSVAITGPTAIVIPVTRTEVGGVYYKAFFNQSDAIAAIPDPMRGDFHEITVAVTHGTGTENLMMAAALADGTTVLSNCAREPEVVDLAQMLNGMGARIRGAGEDEIVIEGVTELGDSEHAVIPDRIETGTYLVAGALIGDEVELQGCRPDDLRPVLQQLESAGVTITIDEDRLRVSRPQRLAARDLRTAPHPGYPTDMQAQYMALMTQARGTALITETIFERRFMHVGELLRMGADIRIEGHTCIVVGPRELTGAQVMATDLRASACLVLAALVADGVSVLHRVYHLDRGYEAMEAKLGALGAEVERFR
jgi:hypothetical protein